MSVEMDIVPASVRAPSDGLVGANFFQCSIDTESLFQEYL